MLKKTMKNWDGNKAPLDTMRRFSIEADLLVAGMTVPTSVESYVMVRHDLASGPRICRGVTGEATGNEARTAYIKHGIRRARERSAASARNPWLSNIK